MKPILTTLASLSVVVVGALIIGLGLLFVIGSAIESAGQYMEQHERCLRGAMNGQEIERCR